MYEVKRDEYSWLICHIGLAVLVLRSSLGPRNGKSVPKTVKGVMARQV